MSNLKHIKIYTSAGELDLAEVEEYVCGYTYFYVRFGDKRPDPTQSINRSIIQRVERLTLGGTWKKIKLKGKVVKDGKIIKVPNR